MPLTPEERQRIYEEEKVRQRARKPPLSATFGCLVFLILLGFCAILYTLVSVGH